MGVGPYGDLEFWKLLWSSALLSGLLLGVQLFLACVFFLKRRSLGGFARVRPGKLRQSSSLLLESMTHFVLWILLWEPVVCWRFQHRGPQNYTIFLLGASMVFRKTA